MGFPPSDLGDFHPSVTDLSVISSIIRLDGGSGTAENYKLIIYKIYFNNAT